MVRSLKICRALKNWMLQLMMKFPEVKIGLIQNVSQKKKTTWERNFDLGRAMDIAVAKKRAKYLEKCKSHKLGFGVLAFTTLGGLGSDTEEFLKRLRNYMASHDENVPIGDFLFHMIGVVLNKGIGAQLVARLPSNSCKLLVGDDD